jgi:hypothetical protein
MNWTLEQVRGYVAAFVRDRTRDNDGYWFSVADAVQAVGRCLVTGGVGQLSRSDYDVLWRQVRRELDKLSAGEGRQLVKVGRGDFHPGGWRETAVAYYPPGSYVRAQGQAHGEEVERRAEEAAWVRVHARLADLGIEQAARPHTGGISEPSLDLDGWEHLLSLVDVSAGTGHHS